MGKYIHLFATIALASLACVGTLLANTVQLGGPMFPKETEVQG
jgi:hypothetical protein